MASVYVYGVSGSHSFTWGGLMACPFLYGDSMGIYWDIGPLLSKNGHINFCLSMRGGGKTYGCKKWSIRDYLNTGKQFIYLRRFKDEFLEIKKFFDDIASEFPKADFTVKGGTKGGTFIINGGIAGYFMPLSTQVTRKSVSYPNVNKIIFDEFLLEKSTYHYLPNEPFYFFNIVETVSRLRHGAKLHDQVRAICLGNNTTVVNPYFEYLGINWNPIKRFDIHDYKAGHTTGRIVIENYKNQEFTTLKKDTPLGAIMANTAYGGYAIDGEFYMDDNTFIEPCPSNIPCMICLKYQGTNVYFWFDYENGLVYASSKGRGECKLFYSLTSSDHAPNYMLIQNAKTVPQTRVLVECFNHGCMRFTSPSIKQTCFSIFQALGIKR